MSKIEFVSHEYFPEDDFTKELVYLCLEGKYRIAYVRKRSKDGNLFWSGVSVCVVKGGQKQYFQGFIQDSNFLEKDIKDFLERRSWEPPALAQQQPNYNQSPPNRNMGTGGGYVLNVGQGRQLHQESDGRYIPQDQVPF